MSIKIQASGLFLFGAVLSGCTPLTIAPAEQIQQLQQTDSLASSEALTKKRVVKNQTVSRYLCKGNQEVRIVQSKNSKNSKSKTINVSFQGSTHTLSPIVTKNGKKYSNIRWIWWEKVDGKSVLYNNKKKVLAERCVKQK